MKKYALIIIFYCIVFSLTACAEQSASEADEITQEENQEENQESADENHGDQESEEGSRVSINVYVINPEDGTLMSEVKECETVNEQIIWDLLKETGSVPEESEVRSFRQEEDKLILNVDEVFGEWLRTQGTAGENEIMGCVVNTFLEAYDCNEIKITEEGQVLVSGHQEYTEYMTKFEI